MAGKRIVIEKFLSDEDRALLEKVQYAPGASKLGLGRVEALLEIDFHKNYRKAARAVGRCKESYRQVYHAYTDGGLEKAFDFRGGEVMLRLMDELRFQPELPDFEVKKTTPEQVRAILHPAKPAPEPSDPAQMWELAGIFVSKSLRVSVSAMRSLPKNVPLLLSDSTKERREIVTRFLPDDAIQTEVHALSDFLRDISEHYSAQHRLRLYIWKGFDTPLPENLPRFDDVYAYTALDKWQGGLRHATKLAEPGSNARRAQECLAEIQHTGQSYVMLWSGRPTRVCVMPPLERFEK